MENFYVSFLKPLKDAIQALPAGHNLPTNESTSSAVPNDTEATNSAIDQDRQYVVEAINQMVELTQQMKEQNRLALNTLEQVAIELAIAAAGHVVFQKIQDDQFPIAEIVADFLQEFETTHPLELFVNPQDLRQIHAAKESDEALSVSLEQLKLTADPTLPRGSARLNGDESAGLFFSVATQLSEIRQELMEKLYDAKIERRATKDADSALRRFPDRRATG